MTNIEKIKEIPTPEILKIYFDKLKIKVRTLEHEPLFTVHDGQDIRVFMRGGHTKNLFLKDKKGKFWLISALESTKIDLKKLHKRINSARLSFGKEDVMFDILGVRPGSVTPFAIINDKKKQVKLLLDEDMVEKYDILNFHPLDNTKTTEIKTVDLIKFIKSCDIEFEVINFKEIF